MYEEKKITELWFHQKTGLATQSLSSNLTWDWIQPQFSQLEFGYSILPTHFEVLWLLEKVTDLKARCKLSITELNLVIRIFLGSLFHMRKGLDFGTRCSGVWCQFLHLLGKFLDLCLPQFTHLWNEDSSSDSWHCGMDTWVSAAKHLEQWLMYCHVRAK